MSYIMNSGPARNPGGTRRRILFTAAAIGLVALLVAAFLIGRQGDSSPGESSQLGPPLPAGPAISWVRLGQAPVPVSPRHGPVDTSNGLASGFAHDELGAVLAAINISARLTGSAGPAVYETTARLQCLGDINTTIATIRSQRSTSPPGTTVPTAAYYRITSGDPNGDLVGVSIALDTPQSRGLGGYGEITRTLQWVDGDWKLHVPPSPPRLITSIRGWTSLGPVPHA
jgi:hypothetical protein